METPKNKPVFNRRIFWDVNFDTLDYDGKSSFIIERVFERGDVDDIRQCRRYYGDEQLCNTLTNARWISRGAERCRQVNAGAGDCRYLAFGGR